MEQTTTLSTIIDSRVKEAATAFCKKRGMKLRHFIEMAVLEQIEDEIDLEAYHQRKHEDVVSLEDILKGRKK